MNRKVIIWICCPSQTSQTLECLLVNIKSCTSLYVTVCHCPSQCHIFLTDNSNWINHSEAVRHFYLYIYYHNVTDVWRTSDGRTKRWVTAKAKCDGQRKIYSDWFILVIKCSEVRCLTDCTSLTSFLRFYTSRFTLII